HSALRTNQALIIALLSLAFVLDAVALVAFVAVVMLVGAAFPPARLFVRVYQHILKPAGLVKPHSTPDNPEPHRFSMLLGGIVSAAAALAVGGGLPALGWGLAGLVVFLAALNLFLGFCAGCFMYYQLNRLGVPGFDQAPLESGA
ncbi:MAG: DUF4395 domain-containing protein, partial [Anaerolineales bacterium]